MVERCLAICCSSARRRSTRIGSIARSIDCSRTRGPWNEHLFEHCGELFAIENDVLLYDMTSTYFEGQAKANPQAQRGYSRDHRPDCKQVCIALVVTFDGFPLGYEVFAGNTHKPRPCRRSWPRWRRGTACWGASGSPTAAWPAPRIWRGCAETGRRYIIGAPKSELKKFGSRLRSPGWLACRSLYLI